MRVHEYLLQSECGYKGGAVYWDEQRDADAGPPEDASVWGAGDLALETTSSGCVADGPFANTTLRLSQQWGVNNYTNFCLAREYDVQYWNWANLLYLEPCFAIDDYVTARPCFSAKPHSSVHLGVGGTLVTDNLEDGEWLYPSAAFLDYDGDDGNITTLNHVLWMANIVPNVTITEVMDMGNDLNCAEYV
ncbi:amino acid transporter [Xylariaceae sp. FL0016]|nr:amino acid transporter [Xylariaceae sp. FL0016]